MVEHLMRGGHFAASCTFLAEVAHKEYIKMAATLSRTEANYNVSQDRMLDWVLWQTIFTGAIDNVSESSTGDCVPHDASCDGGNDSSDSGSGDTVRVKEECHLPYMDQWSASLGRDAMETFISKRVRVTPATLLNKMCRKLELPMTRNSRLKLLTELHWRCFGTLSESRAEFKRKFVGISKISKDRRDFVRLLTPAQIEADDGTVTVCDTCWSAQIIMFIHVSGFTDSGGIKLPEKCRNSPENSSSVRLAFVRWLAPHPDTILRDAQRRPICSPPFDINHALWTFAKEDHNIISNRLVNKNIMNYEGADIPERIENSKRERKAMYDLVDPKSFSKFMNCTRINTDSDGDTILETITIPF